jgi:hypothetical protein
MIKLRIFFVGILVCVITCCRDGISDQLTKELKQSENFWKQRKYLIRKGKLNIEYPQKKDTSIVEKRINRIYIDNMECQFEVFVDDVLLLKVMGEVTKGGGGISADNDINQLLLTSGVHEVKVRMYPKLNNPTFGEEGYLNLKFSYFTRETFKKPVYNESMNAHNGIHIDQQEKQWMEKWDQENQVGYDGEYVAKQHDKFKGLPAYEWHRTFTANVPFDLTGWRNSVNLSKEQEDGKIDLTDELLRAYKNIYEIIEKKDVASYMKLVAEREDLITQTLFYTENEKILRADEFVKLVNNPEYEVEPMLKETFQIDLQGYGKLVCLVHKADGEGIIRLRNKKDPDDKVYLDFRFQRKHKGDKLTVI